MGKGEDDMEHILQFGISIDDDAIKKSIEQNATKDITNELKSAIKPAIMNRWGTLTEAGETIFKEFLAEHKDEIIEKAVIDVAQSMRNSKKYREALAKIVEEL